MTGIAHGCAKLAAPDEQQMHGAAQTPEARIGRGADEIERSLLLYELGREESAESVFGYAPPASDVSSLRGQRLGLGGEPIVVHTVGRVRESFGADAET